jgi:hypothetical protein
VAPAFSASADFAIDKPAGHPCPHLGPASVLDATQARERAKTHGTQMKPANGLPQGYGARSRADDSTIDASACACPREYASCVSDWQLTQSICTVAD